MKTVSYDETIWQLVPIEPTPKMLVSLWDSRESMRGESENKIARVSYKAMLSAAPSAPDSAPPDEYDIAVDTGDGIYHTANVVHFQQIGSKRLIQTKLGDSAPDATQSQAVKDALEAAAKICKDTGALHTDIDAWRNCAFVCAEAIRALITPDMQAKDGE